jgi:hypothetical protein
MTDTYSKVVLTVIAVALCAICMQGVMRGASAQVTQRCGESQYRVCYVEITNAFLPEITVTNGKYPLRVTTDTPLDVRVRGPVAIDR